MKIQLILVVIALVSVLKTSAGIEYRRTVDDAPVIVGARSRVSDKMMFFAEAQLKYGMFQNYLHYWIDRPLLFDRGTRHDANKFAYMTLPSFKIDVEQLRRYGLDGLGSFGNPANKFKLLKLADSYLARLGCDDVVNFPQITYGENIVRSSTDAGDLVDMLKFCLESPRMPRIGGKLLTGSYNHRLLSAEQHRQLRKKIVAGLGRNDFILMGDLNLSALRKLQNAFLANGKLTDGEKNELEKLIADSLNIADGLQISMTMLKRPMAGDYTSSYDTEFFEKYTGPALRKIYSRPEYSGKLLAFFINQGYINHLSGMNHGEYGTATLRNLMRTGMSFNPDYFLFFEWNEANENTCFQPTVYNSFAVQRLIKYYTRLAQKLPGTPNAGDDTSIPNLVLTHRAVAKLGETLRFELLNIPDGSTGTIVATLLLRDTEGKLIHKFPTEQFDAAKLSAVTYSVPSEQFKGGAVLLPELIAGGKTFRGFQALRLEPTVSWNYKNVRQPLRDMIENPVVELKVKPLGGNRYAVHGSFKGGEKLASLELLDNETPLRASGSEKEFDQTNDLVFRIAFTKPSNTPNTPGLRSRGRLEVKNVSRRKISSCFLANTDTGRFKNTDHGIQTNFHFWSQETTYFATIPAGEADKAILVVESDKFGKHELPLGIAAAKGIVSKVLDTGNSLRVEVRRMDALPDLPLHINSTEGVIDSIVYSDGKMPVFTLRAIAKNGKIYRTDPVLPLKPAGVLRKFNCFSDSTGRVVEVSAPAELIPDIEFIFSPVCGVSMLNTWSAFHTAQLGGGFHYMEAYSHRLTRIPVGDRAPEWVVDGGRAALKFDGENDYVNFIRETFPQAAFTLEFEVKPEDSDKTQVLFRHFNYFLGSLSLFRRYDTLYASFGQKDLKNVNFSTNLPIPSGKWSKIIVKYDFKNITFTVNGKSRSFPFSGRAYAFKSSIFGGHTKVEYAPDEPLVHFKGLLRSFRVRHY